MNIKKKSIYNENDYSRKQQYGNELKRRDAMKIRRKLRMKN